jgi:threonine dehydrogenase-like Zn-dependent dehydrogenase
MNKGLTVRSAQHHGQHYMPAVARVAAGGELDPSFLATRRLTLEDGAKGYDLFKHKKDGCVRVVFTP